MNFRMIHENYNVSNLKTSIAFYQKALGLHEVRRKNAADGSFTLSIWQTIRSASSLN